MAKVSQFGYVKRDAKQIKARATMRGGGFDDFVKRDVKKYKVREGKNLIRIMQPTWEDPAHYGYDIFLNYGVGPDNQAYLSLSRHGKGADPLAEARDKARRTGDEETVKQLAPRDRVGVWLIDRLAPDDGPQFWAMPQSFDKALASASTDEDTGEIVYIDDPDDGCDVRFHKEGTGLTTKYPGEKIKLQKPGPLSEAPGEAAGWLEYIVERPIPEILNFYSYDHISQVFNGAAPAKPDVEDEDDKPVPAPKVAARKAAPAPVDDDEDEAPPAKAAVEEDDDSLSIKERLRRRREKLQAAED